MKGNFQNIQTYKDLLDYVIDDLRDISQENIAHKIGFSPKSLYSILNGIEPGKKNRRKLRGFFETKYGVNVEEDSSGKIKIINHQDNMSGENEDMNLNKKTPNNSYNDLKDDISFLSSKIQVLEKEIFNLKKKMNF